MFNTPGYAVDFVVRSARPADAESIVAIWQDNAELLARSDPRYRLAADAGQRWQAALTAWLERPDMAVFVADRGGRILGCLVGTVTPTSPGLIPEHIGTVLEFAVDSHGRGNGGIGTHLLEAFAGWLRPQHITLIEARVPTSHAIAQAFWRGTGAKAVADIMRFKVRGTAE